MEQVGAAVVGAGHWGESVTHMRTSVCRKHGSSGFAISISRGLRLSDQLIQSLFGDRGRG